MRIGLAAVLYIALALSANADADEWAAMRQGDMRKLRFLDSPVDVPATPFATIGGAPATMDDYKGKVVVLNFWATWCAPCRKEMPHLSQLQSDMGGNDFQVVTIAADRSDPAKITGFFSSIGVDNLPLHHDPRMTFARDMGAFGLPVTIVVDSKGQEIARMTGDANWASANAKAILAAIIEEDDTEPD